MGVAVLLQDQTRVAPFSYEHVWAMSEGEFVRLHAIDFPRTWRARIRLVLAALVGGLMLLSPYSAGMGLLVIAVSVFVLALPWLSRSLTRRRFRETRYLHGPVTYGVSGRGFWLSSRHLNAESSWSGLAEWGEWQRWLVLRSVGMPPVYLPLRGLKESGVFDTVTALARVHGRGRPSGSPPGRCGEL